MLTSQKPPRWIKAEREGIHLPTIDWWIDPSRPAANALVTHGHADHCGQAGMLAAELGLAYACLAVSVNWAPGIGSGDIHGQIEHWIATSMAKVRAILEQALPGLAG